MAFATLAEVILVSYLILVANFLSKADMMAWIDSVIGCTADYMAGKYLGDESQEPSQEPWAAPAAWASTDQHIVTQVKTWLAAVATRDCGVVDPIIKIFLEDFHLSLSSMSIYKWASRLCASPRSTKLKPLIVKAERNPQARLLHMLPAVARYLNFNLKMLEIRLQRSEDSLTLDDVTLGSPKRSKAELKVTAEREKARALVLSAECDKLVAEKHALVAKTGKQVRPNKFSTWILLYYSSLHVIFFLV